MEEALGRLMRARALIFMLLALAGVSLRAQDAPPAQVAQAYLYLEPFEARVEAIFDLGTALSWLGETPGPGGVVKAERQAAIREQMMKLAADWTRLVVDDHDATGSIASAAFIKGKPGATLPVAEGEDLPVPEVMIGMVYQFAISGAPNKIELRWKELKAPLVRIPVTIFFGSLSEKRDLVPALPVVRWTNDNRLPKPKPLAEMPVIPVATVYQYPVMMILWIIFGVVVYIYMEVKDKKFPGGMIPFVAAWVLGIAVTSNMQWSITDPFADKAPVIETPAQAETVLQPLLKNVYRAFDYRKEEDIYERLEHSVAGDLLRKLYLQTIQALTLEGQDGTRAHVTDLSANVDKVQPAEKGFVADTEWTALGTVGHWGHSHTRVNRYKARVTVNTVDGEWKMTALEVLEERRL